MTEPNLYSCHLSHGEEPMYFTHWLWLFIFLVMDTHAEAVAPRYKSLHLHKLTPLRMCDILITQEIPEASRSLNHELGTKSKCIYVCICVLSETKYMHVCMVLTKIKCIHVCV